ncbi:hypothetical protein CBL_10584 [Carabus blaptoides fortunei]
MDNTHVRKDSSITLVDVCDISNTNKPSTIYHLVLVVLLDDRVVALPPFLSRPAEFLLLDRNFLPVTWINVRRRRITTSREMRKSFPIRKLSSQTYTHAHWSVKYQGLAFQ